MDALTIRPEPFGQRSGCGCGACRAQAAEHEWSEPEYLEPEYGEPEWDVAPTTDRRPRAGSCTTDMPPEVEGCARVAAQKAVLCRPGSNVSCPEIPEVWTSHTIAGVPFHYGERLQSVPGTKQKRVVGVKDSHHPIRLTPKAWWSVFGWITLMGQVGMPIRAVITAGGRYCRCIKRPSGVCGENNPGGCTGENLSNHGHGDAIDIVGVVWKDPAAVGSSLPATVAHSWADSGDQGKLLVRIDGALRVAFATVFDYARADHRDHFHCDTNRGRGRFSSWNRAGNPSDPCEPFFVMGALATLGYVDTVKPVTWARARAGLEAFARKGGIPVPSGRTAKDFEAIATRLFMCMAMGAPVQCRKAG